MRADDLLMPRGPIYTRTIMFGFCTKAGQVPMPSFVRPKVAVETHGCKVCVMLPSWVLRAFVLRHAACVVNRFTWYLVRGTNQATERCHNILSGTAPVS